jgi:hypothetical protein
MIDQCLPMIRYGQGFLEETHFSWCFVPLYAGTNSIQGFYNAPFETTAKVCFERRTKTLSSIDEHVALAKSVREFWPAVLRGLEPNTFDVPFVLLYSVVDGDGDDDDHSAISTTSAGSSLGAKSCV